MLKLDSKYVQILKMYKLNIKSWLIPFSGFCCGILSPAPPPRIKLEQLQYPKDGGGLAVSNPWLFYLVAQMQHLVGSISYNPASFSASLMFIGTGAETVLIGLEAHMFQKFTNRCPPLHLLKKYGTRANSCRGWWDFTDYSPIWGNHVELAKLHQGPRWCSFGVTLLSHIFQNRKLK